MKILLINYFFPPAIDAHAYRWHQLMRYWSGQGHEVDVITSGDFEDEVFAESHRFSSITRLGRKRKQHSAVYVEKKRTLRNDIKAVLLTMYRKVYWPDAFWHWIFPLTVALFKRRKVRYDLIVSYYPCLLAHIGASYLHSRQKENETRWIADYGDPFSTSDSMQPNNFALYKKINIFVERLILKRCSAVVFTNETTASDYVQAKICEQEKVSVIPHLVDINSFYVGSKSSLLDKTSDIPTIRLIYIGGFHKGIREPDQLFDLVKAVNGLGVSLELDIYGPANGYDFGMYDLGNINHHGIIARELVPTAIEAADFVVNVDNINCSMTPSKIVELIATGKPIVNIGAKNTPHKLFSRYENEGYCFNYDHVESHENGYAKIADFLRKNTGRHASIDIVKAVLDGYDLQDIASQYITAVGELGVSGELK
ncbi:glycosyltransferase [Chromobacterium phragmitis]|uniref:glycosyltransferase n=1 Tax=Chromobacterium amazonense TaxID=1382803 RepID=UPI0021B7A474|nr:glycosyltransferase [Chromobacterium amazonense]MBM2882781.1 glycosyltransferase [Chromobacterium amazonense]MDE1715554.1 glycosyltransferase [Chromobacterium amazonense]